MGYKKCSKKSNNDCVLCASDAPQKKGISCESNSDSHTPKPQAWDFYFLTNDYSAGDEATIRALNTAVACHTNAAAFLVNKCWQWYDGKCDKHHRICPTDIHVSYVSVAQNNCPGLDAGSGSGAVSNFSSLPLGPAACCANNTSCSYENLVTSASSRAPGAPRDDPTGPKPISLVEENRPDVANCFAVPLAPGVLLTNSAKFVLGGGTAPGIIGPTSAGDNGTVLLRVCFNTKSSCIYIKTPTTQNKFSRITAQCGSGWTKSTKCLYTLGMNSGRCSNPNVGGKAIAGNSAITVLKAESSDLVPSCPGGQSLTYCYFSGSLAGANGTTAVACTTGAGSCGQPNANGLFGNCVINVQSLCPDWQHLGYEGLGTDLVFTATPATLSPSTSTANQRGLSFPYTYMALTWYDPLEDCCPQNKCQKNYW